MPEFLLLSDKDGNIHVMKGSASGKIFTDYIVYKKGIQAEPYEEVDAIYSMCLVQAFKVVAIIDKVKENEKEKTTVI